MKAKQVKVGMRVILTGEHAATPPGVTGCRGEVVEDDGCGEVVEDDGWGEPNLWYIRLDKGGRYWAWSEEFELAYE